MKTKNLDKSHLTEKEKKHSVALVALAGLLIITTFGAMTLEKAWFTVIEFGIMVIFASAIGIIGFVWGYVGAMEDERSGAS